MLCVAQCDRVVIKEPRVDLHAFAPRYKKLSLPEGTKGKLIGPGGAVIKRIQATCKAELQVRPASSNLTDAHTHTRHSTPPPTLPQFATHTAIHRPRPQPP